MERTWPAGTARSSSFVEAAVARAAAFLMAADFTVVLVVETASGMPDRC